MLQVLTGYLNLLAIRHEKGEHVAGESNEIGISVEVVMEMDVEEVAFLEPIDVGVHQLLVDPEGCECMVAALGGAEQLEVRGGLRAGDTSFQAVNLVARVEFEARVGVGPDHPGEVEFPDLVVQGNVRRTHVQSLL